MDQPQASGVNYDWVDRAACRAKPTSMFFVDGGQGAKAICAQCAVVGECLAEAERLAAELGEEPAGVWGGMTPAERHHHRRRPCAACGLPFVPDRKNGRFCWLCLSTTDRNELRTIAEARAS